MRGLKMMASGILAACVLAIGLSAAQADKAPKEGDEGVLNHKMKSLAGKTVDLEKYRGKVVLIVNVASHCGYTPQYEGLQALHEKYKDKGLAVLGFPCNQFGKQEPGNSEEIAEFCKQNYGVTFDMFEKIDVNGKNAAPLYKFLTSEKGAAKDPGDVKWNFEKFLIGRDGKVAARFRSKADPASEEFTKLVEAELERK